MKQVTAASVAGRPGEEPPVQAELVRLLRLRIQELGLTQTQAAARMGLKQPNVSKLMDERHAGFSVERLLRFLCALDLDAEIRLIPKPARARRAGKLTVVSEN